MANEKLTQKTEDFNTALIIIENIIESDKNGRFKFSPKERSALLFTTDLLALHLNELKKMWRVNLRVNLVLCLFFVVINKFTNSFERTTKLKGWN